MVTQEELEKMSPEEIAKLQKENCIFCKLIAGQIPSQKVYEDETTLVILDINPARKGHMLVLPKEHYQVLPLMPPDVFDKVFAAAKLVAKAAKKALVTNDVALFLANGAVAGQQSPHALFHVIPKDDGELSHFSVPEHPEKKEENDALATQLQHNLGIMFQKRFGNSTQAKKAGNVHSAIAQNTDAQKSSQTSAVRGESPLQKTASLSKEQAVATHGEKGNRVALSSEQRQEMIANMIEQNADVRELLITNPEEFRSMIAKDQQLVELFKNVDIHVLSSQVKKVLQRKKEQSVQTIANDKTADDENDTNKTESKIRASQKIYEKERQEEIAKEKQEGRVKEKQEEREKKEDREEIKEVEKGKQEIKIGKAKKEGLDKEKEKQEEENQESLVRKRAGERFSDQEIRDSFHKEQHIDNARLERVRAYFLEKPKAKALFLEDRAYFKTLLAKRPDVQVIFEGIDLEVLARRIQEVGK